MINSLAYQVNLSRFHCGDCMKVVTPHSDPDDVINATVIPAYAGTTEMALLKRLSC
jgi:hypothetical protein